MGRDELIAALQQKAADEKQAIWQQAEQDVAAAEREAADERQRLERQRLEKIRQQEQALMLQLNRRVARRLQAARLRMQQRLAGRLETLARQLLADVPPDARRRAWVILADELPQRRWQRMRVHPDDAAAARSRYPDCCVEEDAALGGGLVAIEADEALQIDNSFERRRQRLWPQLLGRLLARLDNEAEGGER